MKKDENELRGLSELLLFIEKDRMNDIDEYQKFIDLLDSIDSDILIIRNKNDDSDRIVIKKNNPLRG